MNCSPARFVRLAAARRPNVRVRYFTSGRQWLQEPHVMRHPVRKILSPERGQPHQDIRHVRPSSFRRNRPGFVNLPFPPNGRAVDFSALLLRDMCECPGCLDPSTKQKLFATPEIPSDITVKAFNIAASGVEITWNQDIPDWPQDHVTELSWDVLRSINRIGYVEPPFSPGPQTIWNTAEFDPLPDIDYEAYMHDDAILHKAVHQLHTHGLLFLTNVPELENSVSTIGERIGPIKNTFYGYTWDVRSVPEAKNVAYTSQNLGFHMDLLYMKQPPHIQLLHCIRSSAKGGASQFTDSRRAAQDLFDADMKAFKSLSKLDVTFHYNHPTTNLYRQQRPVIELRKLESDGRIFESIDHYVQHRRQSHEMRRSKSPSTASEIDIQSLIDDISWSPPFQGPFALKMPVAPDTLNHKPTSEMLGNKVRKWHEAAQKFNELIHRPDGVYERMMRPGECVLFDNRRVLHGRKEFDVGDAGTERWLRGAYLDKDPYMSKLRVLSKRFGERSA